MNKYIQPFATSLHMGKFRFWMLFLTLILSGSAWGGDCLPGDHHDVDFGSDFGCAPALNLECTYAIKYDPAGTTVSEEQIGFKNEPSPAGLTWAYSHISGTCGSPNLCTPASPECLGVSIDVNATGGPVLLSGTVTGNPGDNGCFQLTATSSGIPCSRKYKLHITSDGGGWGDPHITTVDGVHYDFQSAGEFIALRGDGLEIQTRQTAISKQGISPENAYTGIACCVSIYTAVAARVGPHRVTIQPNISGFPDPNGLQIRVDGVLRTLGPDGIDLSSCNCPSAEIQSSGRIVRSADDESIEIHYPNGTNLVVTPTWWNSQQKWYLNVNIYDTTATEGIMGRIAEGSWLPALSDGTTVGPKAEDLHERYVQLYERFADSWRVTDATSLFDYAPGTSTATFTMNSWPRENPSTCLIEGEPVVEPVDEAVAEEHCSEVMGENNRADCIFDVREMGHTGFADAYVRSEQIVPGATRTSLVQDKNQSKPGTTVTFTAKVKRAVSTIGKVTSGAVQFNLNGDNVGNPIAFDANGNAVWSTSSLPLGSHEVGAKFVPSGFDGEFRPSSGKVTHVVAMGGPDKWWASFHVGSSAPAGSFSDDYDPSYSALLDLEYEITPTYSFLGLLGYNHFEGMRAEVDDTYWINLSANVKYYIYRFADFGKVWVNAGVGAYQPESGSTRAGANFGVGLGGDINPQWRWELGMNYHHVFVSEDDIQFAAPQVGVIYKF